MRDVADGGRVQRFEIVAHEVEASDAVRRWAQFRLAGFEVRCGYGSECPRLRLPLDLALPLRIATKRHTGQDLPSGRACLGCEQDLSRAKRRTAGAAVGTVLDDPRPVQTATALTQAEAEAT